MLKKMNLMIISNLLYASPVLFSLLFAAFAYLNCSFFWILCVLASLCESFIVGPVLKMITMKTNTASLRPIYKNNDMCFTHNGMPSGHTSNAVFCMTLVTYYVVHLKGKSVLKDIFILLTSAVVVAGVAWQRIDTNMHTKKQVVIGSFVGLLEGILFIAFVKNLSIT